MKYRLLTAFLIVLPIALAGCNNVPNYREENVNPIVIDEPDTNTSEVTPSQDYSEYKDAAELQTINYEPTNAEPKSKDGDKISVHYSGFLTDGTKFDSSVERGKPFEFVLGQGSVIKGWDEGFVDKSIGDKFTLIIPADKAYGEAGRPGIPSNSVLVFEVEVMDITPAE